MKKLFCLVLVLLICAVSACAEMDVSQMSTGDLVKLKESINMQLHADALRDDSRILFENEAMSIQYDDIVFGSEGDFQFMRITFIINNKTGETMTLRYGHIVINGCTVEMGRYTDIPAESISIDEQTLDASIYLKYGIEAIETIRIVFSDAQKNQYTSNVIDVTQ